MSPVVVPDDPVAGEFASLNDVAILLGLESADDLTAIQSAQATLLLTLASGLIIEAMGRDAAWALSLDPVPAVLRAVTLSAVIRVMNNPTGSRSESEQLGQYQHSVSYTDGAHGLVLTDAEIRLCRRQLVGMTSGSACLESIADTLAVNNPVQGLIEAGPNDPPVYDWTD
jgi:hypothetical protein